MPSPLPRRNRSSFVAHYSTSGGLPHRSAKSASALRFSRPAQRSLTLWPAGSLTPLRSRIQECFSPSRYVLEPLLVLPVGATSYRAGFAPAGINTPFHVTQTDARNKRDSTATAFGPLNLPGVDADKRQATLADWYGSARARFPKRLGRAQFSLSGPRAHLLAAALL
jgi:hypothetical protein